MIYYIILFSILSYLVGSISSSIVIGRKFFNIDVRNYGSKNAGSTNVLRVLGYKAAIPVFIVDILKSFSAVELAYLVPNLVPSTELFYQVKLLFGVVAVIGHIFPLYFGFRGGKGVASMLGLALALDPLAAGMCFSVFLIVFFFTRIVSVSSMSAAFSYPFIIWLLYNGSSTTLTVFSIVAMILMFVTHKQNIVRLFAGEEKKITFNKEPIQKKNNSNIK